MKFYLPTLKHLVIQLAKLQIYTLNLTTTFWHCKNKSHYFWTGVYLGAHCSAIGRCSVDFRVVLDFCLIVSFNRVEQITLFKWPTKTHKSHNTAFFNPSLTTIYHLHYPRDLSRYAPSPWETSLHCNVISHWLGAYLDWSLQVYRSCWSILRSHIVMKSAPHISWLILAKPKQGMISMG